jgi:hypothetical protein
MPGRGAASSKSAYAAVRNAVGNAAASSNVTPSGISNTCDSGTTTRVAYPPKRVTATTRRPSGATPATSNPGVIGQPTYSFADAYSPMRTTQSA